jgi:seryl-tRNA synthetase
MHIQRDRLALSNWLRSLVEADASDPIVKLGQGGRDDLLTLCNNLEAVEVKLRTHPTVSETLDRETLRQRASAEDVLTQLNEIRTEVASLERASDAAQAATNHFDRTERFLGRLEQAIQLYDRADQSSALREEIARLRTEIAQLQRRISEAEIRRKLANTLAIVQNAANQFVPQLDAEWPDAPIELIVDELKIKVIQGTRSDYLWEIGSGATCLACWCTISRAKSISPSG